MFTKYLGAAAVLFVLLQILTPAISEAQDDEIWHFSVPLYVWGAGLEGHIGVLGTTVEIDKSFGDFMSDLNFGLMGAARAHRREWSINGEVIYINFGSATDTGTDVDTDQLILAGDVGYQVATSLEVLAGARIVSLGESIDFQAPNLQTLEADKTWVDPVIGLRFAPTLTDNWSLWTRFDVGGFGMGSDFTWQVNAIAVYSFSEKTAIIFGYRVIDMDYDDDDAAGQFEYDTAQHGPLAGVVFSF